MRVRRRSLRKGLMAAGCLVGSPSSPAWILGLLSLLLGSMLHLWAKGVLEQNERLTTAGPYRWTRNPFYLANLLIDGGLCGVIGIGWLGAVYLGLWGWSYRETIVREEERLAELFGEDFERYRAEVPRFWPAIRPWPVDFVCGRFRWSNPNLARGREYARLLGILLAPGAIWAAGCLRREGLEIFAAPHWLELGGILLLVCGWILKLALGETFRRPESSLLPLSATPRMRALIAIGLCVPLWLASEWGWSVVGIEAGALLLVGFVWGGSLPEGAWGRIGLDVACGLGVLGIGILSQRLWLACVPSLWLALSALDGFGRRRGGSPARKKASGWSHFPKIVAGSGAAVLAVAGMTVWMR